MATDFPPGFIGRDDRTAADRGAEGRVGRLRLPRGACDGLHQAAARDGQPEPITEQLHDPAHGKPALFIENDGERDGVRPELRGRRAKGIGRLQRMAALHPTVTLSAAADRHAKLMDERALHRQIFLVLRDDAVPGDRPTAVRTVRGQRRVMRHIDVRRRSTMGRPPIGRPWFATGSTGVLLGEPTRERGGLSIRATPRHLQLLFQPLVFASQSMAFDFRALQILAQPFDLARLIVDDLSGIWRRRIFRAPRHPILMPERRSKYKRESGSAER
jgi:hypothetical protein